MSPSVLIMVPTGLHCCGCRGLGRGQPRRLSACRQDFRKTLPGGLQDHGHARRPQALGKDPRPRDGMRPSVADLVVQDNRRVAPFVAYCLTVDRSGCRCVDRKTEPLEILADSATGNLHAKACPGLCVATYKRLLAPVPYIWCLMHRRLPAGEHSAMRRQENRVSRHGCGSDWRWPDYADCQLC